DWISGGVDIYETVCYKGYHWDVLYFHMHHPRRSKQIPKDYTFSDFHPQFSRIPIVIGTNLYVENFPFDLTPVVKRFFGSTMELFIDRILDDYEKSVKSNPKNVERPHGQIIKLQEALVNIAARSTTK